MIRILTLSILVIITASCSMKNPFPAWHRWPLEGPPKGQEYTKLYKEGWVHGCETGTHATVNQYYKFFYSFKQDPIKAQNRVYYKGWKDAFTYCHRYLYQHARRSF